MKPTTVLAIACLAASTIAAQGADTPRLHPVKAACVTYEMTGPMQSGSMVRCHRKHGYEQYEIQNVKISVSGFSQVTHQHAITIGDTIYSIDLKTKTGTKTKNPFYENISNALKDSSAEEMSQRFISAMNFRATGQTKTIAGHECEIYRSPQIGEACLMPNGLMLEQSVMGMGQTATEVTLGDGGDDANYRLYETVEITDGPDVENLLKQLNLGQ